MQRNFTAPPNREHDTTEALWDVLYRCRVPELATLTDEDIREFGLPTCGIDAIDKQLRKAYMHTYISIARMIELYEQDIPIYLVDPADSKLIYEAITDHLIAWKNEMLGGLTPNQVPADDLILMDTFATMIYPHAIHHFTTEIYNSFLEKGLSTSSLFNPTNILGGRKPLEQKIKDPDNPMESVDVKNVNRDEPQMPKRESYADIFQERALGLSKWGVRRGNT